MKTLPVSIELSNLAFESVNVSLSIPELMMRIDKALHGFTTLLGGYCSSYSTQKNLGHDLRIADIQFNYEKYSIHIQLASLGLRYGWKVQNFQVVDVPTIIKAGG